MKTLQRQLKVFNKDVEQRVNVYKRKLAQTIALKLIMATPVDTSTALSNWIASLGQAKGRLIQAHSVGTKGSTEAVSSTMAYSMANAIIQRAKVGEIVYITNSVDYIQLLNYGTSSQAERYFIQHAVEDAVVQIKRVKI